MKKVRIKDICEVVSGTTPKTSIDEYWDGDIDWITPAELKEDSYIIEESIRKITELAVDKTALKAFPKGTVILSSRAPIGKVAIAGKEMYCNQGFKNLICSERISSFYLYWFLKGKTVFLNSLGRGATFKEISKGIVENIEIPLPSLEVQAEISERLKKCTDIIRLRKEQLEQLDKLIKSRFVEMFGDEEYTKVTLKDICLKITDGTHKTPDYQSKGITFISAKNIVNGNLDFSDVKYILDSEYEEIQRRCQTEKGDILLSKSGSLGAPVIVQTDEKLGLFESLAVIKADWSKINNVFLCEQLKSDEIQRQFMSGTKGVAIKHLHLNVIGNVCVILPPIELQNQFAAFVRQVDKLKFYNIITALI